MAKTNLYDTYKSAVSKAKNRDDAAYSLMEAISKATSGLLNRGISDAEQKQIVDLIDLYGKQWNVDTSEFAERWDPSVNSYTNDLVGWFNKDYKNLVSDTNTWLTEPAKYKSTYQSKNTSTSNKASTKSNTSSTTSKTNLSSVDNNFGYMNNYKTDKLQSNVKTNTSTNKSTSTNKNTNNSSLEGRKSIANASNNYSDIPNYTAPSTTTTPTRTSSGGGGGGTTPNNTSPTLTKDDVYDIIAEWQALNKPKVYSADEIADILKADYGVEDIHTLINADALTKQFNDESNAYYDAMIAAENNYRNQYLRNTGGEYERLINDYIQSTRNNAKTRYNNSRNAMNTLQSQLYGNRTLGLQDTEFNQAVNQLDEARRAEIANNPNLAKQFATNERTKLAQIGLNYTEGELAAYSADRQAMANRYLADRGYTNDYIDAFNTAYKAAAQSAATRASGYTNTNLFQQIYDYYNSVYPNLTAEQTARLTSNTLSSGYKNTQASNK